jgi:N-dimethylarginine dimethylaminohydrolase
MAAVIPRLYSSVKDLHARSFSLSAVDGRRDPEAILMCEPTYFNVVDAKNPFMAKHVGACDVALAKKQWTDLRAIYEKLGYKVHTIPGVPDIEDMVFAANQVLPGRRVDGSKYVVLSNMTHASRRREVPYYAAWFEKQGYEVLRISPNAEEGPRFEGQGDGIWHPQRNLLWGAYGFRSDKAAYDRITQLTGADIILLRLVNENLYHLDTSLCPLDPDTALVVPAAFDADGLAMIRTIFNTVLEIPEDEALNNFAGNGIVLGKNVILQRGSNRTCELIRSVGYTPIEVETSEFMKSGGSVFCLKMMVY